MIISDAFYIAWLYSVDQNRRALYCANNRSQTQHCLIARVWKLFAKTDGKRQAIHKNTSLWSLSHVLNIVIDRLLCSCGFCMLRKCKEMCIVILGNLIWVEMMIRAFASCDIWFVLLSVEQKCVSLNLVNLMVVRFQYHWMCETLIWILFGREAARLF